MKAVVGLGNPGSKYAGTRHNIGFMLVNQLAAESGAVFRRSFQGEVAEIRVSGAKALLFKPLTYMNLSGQAVRPLLDYYKLLPEESLVVCDDLDLPLGKLRLRQKGSAGGHNGLKSLIQELGSQEFWRLRIGVGRPLTEAVVTHVLSGFEKEEREEIAVALDRGCKAVTLWLQDRGDEAMNIYNRSEVQ